MSGNIVFTCILSFRLITVLYCFLLDNLYIANTQSFRVKLVVGTESFYVLYLLHYNFFFFFFFHPQFQFLFGIMVCVCVVPLCVLRYIHHLVLGKFTDYRINRYPNFSFNSF